MKIIRHWFLGIILSLLILFETGYLPAGNSGGLSGGCSINPILAVSEMLTLTSQDQWLSYLEDLTGDQTVLISGEPNMISTRYSPSMFEEQDSDLAFRYIVEQLVALHYPPNDEVNHYGYMVQRYNNEKWKNLILTIPSWSRPFPPEIILAAHLDSLPEKYSPGAGDNAVGAAALLEMARVLRYFKLGATIKLIWFTGEEQGLLGSKAYVQDYGPFTENLLGVINLDSFGYDSDGDNCSEIHAGINTKSYPLGDCLINSINAYSLPISFDYLKLEVPGAASDHLPFWERNIAAINISDNHYPRQEPDDYHHCGENADANPFLHTNADTIEKSVDLPFAFNIVKASLATASGLSKQVDACFSTQPILALEASNPYVILKWQRMGDMVLYRLSRSESGCEGPWQVIQSGIYSTTYIDNISTSPDLVYRLEAMDASSMCISLPSNCLAIAESIKINEFLPMVIK